MSSARALVAALTALAGASAFAAPRTIIVRAPDRDYRDAFCRVLIDAPKDAPGIVLRQGDRVVASQARRVGGRTEVAWLVSDLRKGDSREYAVSYEAPPSTMAANGVTIERKGADLEIRVGGSLFAKYDATTGPNKPYFWPIYGPGNKLLVRSAPLAKVEGETTDHPHHRGLWFTHGAVNGMDFWSEGASRPATRNRTYDEVTSGQVCGVIRATTDWVDPTGKKVAEDTRQFTVFAVRDAIVLDFDTVMRATEGPLVFGDTKEGSFGIRIPDSMRVTGGGGHMLSATGLTDKAVWGKRAEWIDYYGPVDGETMGIAILDNPANLRHPTYWHARDYGLFAANPFGIRDFVPGQKVDAGNYTLAAGGTQPFRYRVIFHRGDTSAAGIAGAWTAYANGPIVSVK